MGARVLSRDETKLLTRHRLIQAALELLAEHGREGLTTGRVAARAGMAQPTFYVHFADMDALLEAVASEQVEKLRPVLRRLRRRLEPDSDQQDPARVRDIFIAPLEEITAHHRRALALLLSEKHRPDSALGRSLRALLDEVTADLVGDLRRMGIAAHFTDEQLLLACDAMVSLTLTFAQGYLEGRYSDLRTVADMLTTMVLGVLRG